MIVRAFDFLLANNRPWAPFAQVYRGLNSITGELFALKEIELRASANSSAVQMKQAQKLGEEIAVMNNLSHPHIVRCVCAATAFLNLSAHAQLL